MAGTGQIRGRRGIIGGYWGGYNSLSSSPTPRALPGKVENLTPPANGKNAPDGAPPAQAVPCWNVASWNRCARISAGVGNPAPERGADPHRPRYAPGRTRRSRSHRQCRQKARAAAHHAPPPWPFSFAAPSPACHLPGLPDQQPGTRWVLCRRRHDDHASTPQPQQTAPAATCTGKDQHRQRRIR